jgi:ABC-type phosphate/phosphonate transport system permease subunit
LLHADLIRIKADISGSWNTAHDPDDMEAQMLRLAGILYSLIATTLAGSAVIAVLTAGYDTLLPILIAAVVGAVVALPVSYFVAREITQS